ncbi:Putative cation exchanger C3A12.06c [Cladobotryum mycophilum]|uniref:Cation exchanger C3A12.06c n=1 Tax=Cladobotryum mycophilum TaxID=491253 RepID=A0ABR0SE02_9HYPO
MRATNKSRRGSNLSIRPFYITVLLLSILTAYSFLTHTQFRHRDSHNGASLLLKRKEKLECRDVHTAQDQCAFVKRYCLDDDAGLIQYLRLYYCTLGEVQPIAFVVLVVWLGLLFTTIGIAASDFFSVNLSTIATILGLSESLAGVTFLAFGNGSPDVFSTFAAMSSNSASMAVGELIGAASFITGVVAGSMALVREFKVDRKTYARDICFFIAAVAFTMTFLADGLLQFWECCVMGKTTIAQGGEARSHYYGLGGQAGDELAGEPYRDDPDDVDQTPGRPSNPRTESNFSMLEGNPRIEVDGQVAELGVDVNDEEAEEDHERMVAAEVSRSMRVLRTGGQAGRRNTLLTPIRPSLVGALEFRSALAHLQRESNLQLSTIPARSYSENHINHRERRGTIGAVPELVQSQYDGAVPRKDLNVRERALSSGNVPLLSSMPSNLLNNAPDISHLEPPQEQSAGQRTPSPTPSYVVGGKLAPPPVGQLGIPSDALGHESAGESLSPRLQLLIPSRRSSHSDRSSPSSPFPIYTDSPMLLTPHPQSEHEPILPSPAPIQRDSPFADLHASEQLRPVRWWPYSVLPPPQVLLATLFPTLQGWSEKTYWDKFVSAISVPSIFLLVITLPVVESETSEDATLDDGVTNYSSHAGVGHMAPPISIEPGEIEPEDEWERYRRHSSRRNSIRSSVNLPPPILSLEQEDTAVSPSGYIMPEMLPGVPKPVSEALSVSNANDERSQWSRWLVCLQLFMGPLFAVIIFWANVSEDWESPGKELVRMLLWTLLVSLILLGALLLFTSEDKPPKYHFLFCFLGFIISIAWISTIAGEVVGVLKTFGVVLGISEALLGLTIFAAGNSVGDLVADITVARLGYPVMALSACFGGPMLNILLGIGIGGVLMMVEDANRHYRKHPDRNYSYGPYHVQIGGTLMISSITLLVMLVGLLIAVPMNKWVLSRKIGWILIALWILSTIINVIVEVTGIWGDISWAGIVGH